MPESNERRTYERRPIRTTVTLSILTPDETFTPKVLDGIATDVSPIGMRIKSPLLSEADCEKLSHGHVYARAQIIMPETAEVLSLKADIFWSRYHEETPEERAHGELGLAFRTIREEDRKLLGVLVEHFSSGSRRRN